MTGLKSGSGDDLWDDDTEEESESEGKRGEPDDGTGTESAADRDRSDSSAATETTEEQASNADGSAGSGLDTSTVTDESVSEGRPYIIRRAVQDKSVQFERDERLTFFVHDDVVEGERDLITDVQATLGRDVPKFDVREAVYRAALQNPDDVLAELLEMGYSTDTE